MQPAGEDVAGNSVRARIIVATEITVICASAARKKQYWRTLLIILLVLFLLGALPTWPYGAGWGYYPSVGLGLVLLIVVILILAKRI